MTKAKRATIALGDIPLDVFQLSDGNYCMSQTQVAEVVGKDERNAREFLQSKRAKALPGIADTPAKNIEVDNTGQTRGQTRIVPWPIGATAVYWYFQAKRGNKIAEPLIIACLCDSLLRRADEAFGVVRTMEEYNQELVGLRRSLSTLSDNYTIDDDARTSAGDAWRDNQRLRDKIYELGGNPDD